MKTAVNKSKTVSWRHRPWVRRLLPFAAAVLFAFGVWRIIAWWRTPALPAVNSSSWEQVIDSLGSEAFLRADSRQRQAYIQDLSQRYWQLGIEDQKRVEQQLLSLPKPLQRQLQRQVGLQLGHQLINSYERLSPAEREAALQRLQGFARALGLKGGVAASLTGARNPVADAAASPQAFQEGVASFQRDLLENFSAEERKTLSQMGKDLYELNKKKAAGR